MRTLLALSLALLAAVACSRSDDRAPAKQSAPATENRSRLEDLEKRVHAGIAAMPSVTRENVPLVLRKLVAIDQELRKVDTSAFTEAELGVFVKLAIGEAETARQTLEEIIALVGWPTIDGFGATADADAWLIVQHADHDRAFQRRMLALLEGLPAGATDPQNIALLTDRIAIAEGRPQTYGTQGECRGGAWEPLELMNPTDVDQRRASVGLPPLSEYAAAFAAECGTDTQ